MALIETNFIRPQEVYDRNTGESKVRYRSYDGNDRFIPVVDGEKGVPKTMVEVTHAELKAMRDGGKLTAGALYRITDYNCTTTQENTQSANHQFDIVLLALSNNKLAEEGWAMMHENDTYFANSNLSAWKVWYCLDNDTARFAWADDRKYIIDASNIKCYRNLDEDITVDNVNLYGWVGTDINGNSVTHWTDTENPQTGDIIYDDTHYYDGRLIEIGVSGKGVIYRLIDEWNNDVAYDFKNIQFAVKLTDGEYDPDNGKDTWCYTFNAYDQDNGECLEASVINKLVYIDDGYNTCVGNTITSNNEETAKNITLGNNVLLGIFSLDNDLYTYFRYNNIVGCISCIFKQLVCVIALKCNGYEFPSKYGAIYINNKIVLTES